MMPCGIIRHKLPPWLTPMRMRASALASSVCGRCRFISSPSKSALNGAHTHSLKRKVRWGITLACKQKWECEWKSHDMTPSSFIISRKFRKKRKCNFNGKECNKIETYSISSKLFGMQKVNSLWPNDTIWWQRSGSTLAQVMACCLMATSHYLNQCWFTISKVHWH